MNTNPAEYDSINIVQNKDDEGVNGSDNGNATTEFQFPENLPKHEKHELGISTDFSYHHYNGLSVTIPDHQRPILHKSPLHSIISSDHDEKPTSPSKYLSFDILPGTSNAPIEYESHSVENSEMDINVGHNLHAHSGSGVASHRSSKSSIQSNFITRLQNRLIIIMNSSFVRNLRFGLHSIYFKLIIYTLLLVTVSLFIVISLFFLPQVPFPHFSDYNAFHIAYTLSGHIVFYSCDRLLHAIHFWILGSALATKGCTISDLKSTLSTSKIPGAQLRRYMWVLSLIIAVFVSYTAFRFGWKPVIAKFMTDKCIPPTYNSSRISIPASSFSQGAVNQATIYSYGIPLADGIIGGWGGWPLVTPNTDFSIKHSGIVYLLSVDCSEVYPATQAYTDTRTWTQNFKQIGNAVLGTLVIYTPQNSIILDYDQVSSQFGYMQECTVITQFFPGIVESSFHVDQWAGLNFYKLLSITASNLTVSSGTANQYMYSDFEQHKLDDQYNMLRHYRYSITKIFNNGTFTSSKGEVFSNIFEWATLPDRFYHDSLMSQGVMGAFASVAHLLLMQYNSSVTDQCDYYGQDGTGYLDIDSTLVTILNILLLILGVILFLHMWWIYLIYGFKSSANHAYNSIRSRFRFACDFTNGGQGVFSTSSGKRRDFMANEDEINLIGDKFVKFGFDKNSLEREFDRGTAIGLKRKIVGLSHFKK